MKLRLAGLHLQLLGLILLPFSLILLAVALSGVAVHQDAMRQLVAERDERATRAAASALSEQLRHRAFAIRGIASRLTGPNDAPEVIEQSGFLDSDFDLGIAVVDATGTLIASSAELESWKDRPLKALLARLPSEGAEFSSPFEEGQGQVVLVGAGTGAQFAVGAFSVSKLVQSTLIEGMAGGGVSASAFVTDSQGNLVQHVGDPPSRSALQDHPGVTAALRGEFGSFYRPASGGEHVVAFSPIDPLGWSLVIEEPWQSVSTPLLDISFAAPLALIPAFLITLLGLWLGGNQVIRPLRELRDRAESLDELDEEALGGSVGGIAEIQQLQLTLERMARRVGESRRALQGYISAITQAQEEERRRLARELHDETIQDLIAIDQRVQMLIMELKARDAQEVSRLEELHREINRSVHDVRRITRALRPIFLEDLGLVPAIQMLVEDLQKGNRIQVELDLAGEPRRLGRSIELTIYRIVQEALNNVARHAQADTAKVSLSFSPEGVQATVRDDGGGFESFDQPSDLAAKGHFGIMGMHERAALIGAHLEIRSTPGVGTFISLSLEVPIAAPPIED